MKVAIAVFGILLALSVSAADLKFNFKNEDLHKVIDAYSKATGQKFVLDSSLRGKISIIAQDKVSPEEAFNLLSSALATNGYAISKQNDTMVVRAARNIQRDLVETSTTLPSLKPERMVVYIYTFQHIPVEAINRDLRILASRDGELNIFPRTNQIIMTDWVSNLHRIDQIFKQLDQPLDAKTAKLRSAYDKEASRPQTKKTKLTAEPSSETKPAQKN